MGIRLTMKTHKNTGANKKPPLHTTPAQPKTLRSLRGDRSSTPERNKPRTTEPPDRKPKPQQTKASTYLRTHVLLGGTCLLCTNRACPPPTSTCNPIDHLFQAEMAQLGTTAVLPDTKRKRCGSAHCCPSPRERTAQSTPQHRLAEERCNATANYLGVVSSRFLLAFIPFRHWRKRRGPTRRSAGVVHDSSVRPCYRPHRHKKKTVIIV